MVGVASLCHRPPVGRRPVWQEAFSVSLYVSVCVCLCLIVSVLPGPLRAPAATRPPDGSSSRKKDRPGHAPGPATKIV